MENISLQTEPDHNAVVHVSLFRENIPRSLCANCHT